MPEVSRFLGMVVTMYFEDHPPPHIHVRYGDQRIVIAIETLEVLAGSLPPRCTELVREWAALHRDEICDNWTRLERGGKVAPIEPLS